MSGICSAHIHHEVGCPRCEALPELPSSSELPCDHCGSRHGADFLFNGHRFCCECMSALTSWMLDGGMVEQPDLYAYALRD